MKNIARLLGGYLVVGIAILLIQTVLVEALEPSCNNGLVEHRIWHKHLRCGAIERGVELCTQEPGGELKSRGMVRAAKVVLSWLPDVAGVFGDPEMTLKEYFLGGYQCREAGPPGLGQIFQTPRFSTRR